MKKYIVDETDLTNIGNAIRTKGGTSKPITIKDMPTKINEIDGGKDDPTRKYVQDGLIGFISLNGNGNDFFGNFKSLKTTMSYREDYYTKKLARESGYGKYNASKIRECKDFTISFWMRSPKITTQCLFTLGERKSDYHTLSMYQKNSLDGTIKLYNGYYYTFENVKDVFDNQWHQIILTYDKAQSEMQTFIDNEIIDENPKKISLLFDTNRKLSLNIGCYYDEIEPSSAGVKISNFMIYDRKLTTDEIAYNFKADETEYKVDKGIGKKKAYTPCEYISMPYKSNAIYLDVISSPDLEMDIDFKLADGGNCYCFGAYASNGYSLAWYGKWYWCLASSEKSLSNGIKFSDRQLMKFNSFDGVNNLITQTVNTTETTLYSASVSPTSFGLYNINIGSRSDGTIPETFAPMIIYDIKIYNNKDKAKPLKHFIPCLDNNGLPCLYEEVENIYYYDDYVDGCSAFDYKEATV